MRLLSLAGVRNESFFGPGDVPCGLPLRPAGIWDDPSSKSVTPRVSMSPLRKAAEPSLEEASRAEVALCCRSSSPACEAAP